MGNIASNDMFIAPCPCQRCLFVHVGGKPKRGAPRTRALLEGPACTFSLSFFRVSNTTCRVSCAPMCAPTPTLYGSNLLRQFQHRRWTAAGIAVTAGNSPQQPGLGFSFCLFGFTKSLERGWGCQCGPGCEWVAMIAYRVCVADRQERVETRWLSGVANRPSPAGAVLCWHHNVQSGGT